MNGSGEHLVIREEVLTDFLQLRAQMVGQTVQRWTRKKAIAENAERGLDGADARVFLVSP